MFSSRDALDGPVTSDVPFADPCVVGRTPGLVCWTLPTTQGPANGTSRVTGPPKPGQNGV